MKDYSIIQIVLFNWFKHHNIRSIQQIRGACKSLINSFGIDCKYYLYHLFFPLVRKGFIEFIGNKKYQIAYPVIVHNRRNNLSVGVNLTSNQIKFFADKFHLTYGPDPYLMIRFNSKLVAIKQICDESDIHLKNDNITGILSRFPTLKEILFAFEPSYLSQKGLYYNIRNHQWEKTGVLNHSGIFKMSEEARKYYFVINNKATFAIPDMDTNPDGRYIAECYQSLIEGGKSFLFYNPGEKLLRVENLSLPIILDRVLRIPSLHLDNGVIEKYGATEYKDINMSVFKQLNRIFCSKIGKI